jgi:glycosyltransferase involved in cell wall biosynthesis
MNPVYNAPALSTATPYFSVVIPTRNRANLLRDALRCATAQTFDDYEIVVSNNDSSDDTESVIAEFAGPKVRWVRTSSSLPMPDHWEFALTHARGRYVTFLCDDDAVAPNLLERTAKAIDATGATVLAAPWIPYYLPTWFEPNRRNALLFARYSGKSIVNDSRESLRAVYSARASVWTPRMLNSFARRDVIDKAHANTGGLFFLSPDFSFAVSILNAVDSWVLMDEPLRLFGVAPEGIGAAMTYDRNSTAAIEFVRDFGKESLLRRVPVLRPLTVNHIAETLMWMQEKATGPAMQDVVFDRAQYYIEVRRNIDELASHGTDVSVDRRMFDEALGKETADVQTRVRTTPDPPPDPLRARLVPLDSWLRRRFFQMHLARGVLLRGEQWGFRDIVEAAQLLSHPVALGLN